MSLQPLSAKKEDDDLDSGEQDEDSLSVSPVDSSDANLKLRFDTLLVLLKERWELFVKSLPPAFVETLQTVSDKANTMKVVFFGFLAGAVFAFSALLVPIYSQVESLSQPVTLFETILGDLEQAYVDEVDTQKLFETGVSAMLRSLDPYTEFESMQAAADLTESIDGKYAGVGLVISGATQAVMAPPVSVSPTVLTPQTNEGNKLLPNDAKKDNENLKEDGNVASSASSSSSNLQASGDYSLDADEDEDDDDVAFRQMQDRQMERARNQGIRVVSAMEGYAFDYGLRVGDRLMAIDDEPITESTTVEQVRNNLRGEPGTLVSISFERDGVDGVQTITMPRSVVRLRDVKLATLLGRPEDGIGYIQLSGFASETGREMRNAIQYLQQATEDATNGERSLQSLVLDLRGNPGGLLTSAVDVASLLVPKGSDIVSAKGRGFPGILYRSRVDPILNSNTKLAVLINGGTASAAEIVAGAVQDLDVGVIVGSDRTFGKGLVQNVEDLPFNTALKFTVAKYYTPSGRCIQGINYKEGDSQNGGDGKYVAKKVAAKDRSVFYTRNGRTVKDGGGIEADYKVEAPKASALEVTLLRSGVLGEFAAEWSKHHELTNNFEVDDDTYKSFQSFVAEKQRSGELKLDALYDSSLGDLRKALKRSGYRDSERFVEQLQASIVKEAQKDFEKYRSDIKEDISQSILARYLPESMLLERGVKNDRQVEAAVKLLVSGNKVDKMLARSDSPGSTSGNDAIPSSLNLASDQSDHDNDIRSGV